MHISRIDSLGAAAGQRPDGAVHHAWWTKALGSTNRQLVIAAFVLATVGFATSEKIGVFNGLGWDGSVYAELVRDFRDTVAGGTVDDYRVQRILPSAILNGLLSIFHSVIKDRHIIAAFGVINILCTALIAWLWGKIADELAIGVRGKWLGFTGLIVNFAMTKNAFFYPVLNDVAAMAMCTAALYFYLRNWQFRLIALIAAGAFTWPTFIYFGSVLVMFPRRGATNVAANNVAANDVAVRPAPRNLHWLFGGLATYYLALWAIYSVRAIKGPMFGYLAPIESLTPLSIALTSAYVLFALTPLFNNHRLYQPRQYFTPGNAKYVVVLLAVVVVCKIIQASLSGRPGIMGLPAYLLLIGIDSIAKPGVFFVSHVSYYGPLFILALFVWKPAARLINQHGLGLTIVVALGVVHSLDSESRHANYLIPFAIPFIVKAIEPLAWSRAQYALIAVLAVVSSKMWLAIKGSFVGNAFFYPDQLYLMNIGPFMGNEMYCVQAALTAVAALLVYLVCFHPAVRRSAVPAAASHYAPSISIRPPHVRAASFAEPGSGW